MAMNPWFRSLGASLVSLAYAIPQADGTTAEYIAGEIEWYDNAPRLSPRTYGPSIQSCTWPSYPNGAGGCANTWSMQGQREYNALMFMASRRKLLIAHGVLAALAFVILFPTGAILMRLGSFRGLWVVHAILQTVAYIIYIAAFGIGVTIVREIPVDLLGSYHPSIGIFVFTLLAFQPILGLMHHFQFRKYARRTIWSHGHLWLGRIIVTLGMINGGLGMRLATQTGYFYPSKGQKAAYGVVAGIMYCAWAAATVVGERRRLRSRGRRLPSEVDDQERGIELQSGVEPKPSSE